jgi:hypothetical protein
VIRATARWLASPKRFWAGFLTTLAALAWCLALGATEPVFRITGLVLQLLGVSTIAWGLSETRAFFGRPAIASTVRNYFKAAPFLPARHVSATANITLGGMTVKGRGYGTENPATPAVEDRLTALESNIQRIHNRITGLEHEYDAEFRQLTAAVKDESSARSSELAAVNSRLERFGTGGIHISAIGAVWLFVGLILSTAGVEIARALGNA